LHQNRLTNRNLYGSYNIAFVSPVALVDVVVAAVDDHSSILLDD
jgi:hypothetical protein